MSHKFSIYNFIMVVPPRYKLWWTLRKFITKWTTLTQSNTTQVYFNSRSCHYMYTTCFGLYLGHLQALNTKILTKEDIIKIKGPLV